MQAIWAVRVGGVSNRAVRCALGKQSYRLDGYSAVIRGLALQERQMGPEAAPQLAFWSCRSLQNGALRADGGDDG